MANESEPITGQTTAPFEVHLMDGTVLNGAPTSLDNLESVFDILAADGVATLPCNDGSVCYLATNRINYIVGHHFKKEA